MTIDEFNATLLKQGEEKHSQCLYGSLTPSWIVSNFDAKVETPNVIPLCLWSPTEKTPPGYAKAWGGAVSFTKDCALCEAYKI